MGDIVIVNCTVADGRAASGVGPVADAAVLVRGDRIAAVGPREEILKGAGDARRVDLGGAYLTPGLVNMHTHLSLSLPGAGGDGVKGMGPHELALYMADGARRTLHCGVTTVRCVAEKDHADFALRRAIDSGRVPGPRVFTAGRALVCTGGHGHEGTDTLECDGPDGFRRGTRAQIRAGADLIKVMISGGIAGEHERIDTPQLFADEMAAVLSTAHAWGRKVTAHAGPAAVIAEAVRLGLDCVEHGYELTPEVAALMAERGTALVPTLLVTRCKEFFDELGVPEWMQCRSLGAGPRHLESYAMALAAGVEVLLGSDMPPFWDFEGTNATVRELEHMSDSGLGPARALYAATLGPARWLGADADLGTVEPGRYADLIAMDADPLAATSAFRTVRWVMKGGEVVRDDRAAAPTARAVVPAAGAVERPDPAETIADTPADGAATPGGELTTTGEGDMELYDLRVVVDRIEGRSVCGMEVGDCFELERSAQLRLPDGKHFCVYAMASVLPFLAAKQRDLADGDWLAQDSLFSCPDPEERLVMRVERTRRRRMDSADLT
ncbi:TIGR04076 family protein [Sphaerisporangium fuscum]|uniref:TIGR04076 family protein n=1 Tax=Sphaerisporangium fuscum TaxID=2835868 RepID=UPI001BDCE282|nr:TIGR04076 family protein [Sphaerisporangium fuscum]